MNVLPTVRSIGGIDRSTVKMIREDLTALRRKWLTEADRDLKEQRRREKCDFLKYVDS